MIDTHHVALLVAAGASAVFPYMALEQAAGHGPGGAGSYRSSLEKGLRKVIARMGISTMASYRNSHLFEIIGLDPEVCSQFFEDASCSLAGKSLTGLLQDCLDRHAAAFAATTGHLQDNGLYRFRHHGEQHATSPELVRRMHRYIKSPTEENHRAFVELGHQREPVAVRDLLEIVPGKPQPMDQLESEASILSRFSTQAMSLGAISPETHRTLAIAMNRLGGRSNTGEGGEDPEIYRDGGEANNRVKQVASARFGVTAEYLVHADELEIKIAQGAKPGEGGQLPATKVSVYIARLRHAVPKMMLISPPPHHDIYSIEDLAQLIYDLRAVNPQARIGVKLVASARSWHHRHRSGQGWSRCHHHQRSRRRHRRIADYFDQEHRHSVGSRSARCAFRPGQGRIARPGSSARRWRIQVCARRHHRRASGCGGIWLWYRLTARTGMRDGAAMSSQHLSGWNRHPG